MGPTALFIVFMVLIAAVLFAVWRYWISLARVSPEEEEFDERVAALNERQANRISDKFLSQPFNDDDAWRIMVRRGMRLGPRERRPRRDTTPRGTQPRLTGPRQAEPRQPEPRRDTTPRGTQPRLTGPRQAEPGQPEPRRDTTPRGTQPRQPEPRRERYGGDLSRRVDERRDRQADPARRPRRPADDE